MLGACGGYNGDNQLPIDPSGLNLAYGNQSACVQLYFNSDAGAIKADPDQVVAEVTLTYGTNASAVPSCPAAVVVTGGVSYLPVFFTYTDNSGYPNVCGTGALNCSGSGQSFTCYSLLNGTHNFYPSASESTTITPWVTGPLPAQCGKYGGDNLLPIDTSGLDLPYGTPETDVCVQLYLDSDGNVKASPDQEVQEVTLTYGTNASAVPSCPAAVVAAVPYVPVFFTYATTGGYPSVCGSGALNCSGSGQNFLCYNLLNGTHVNYQSPTSATQQSFLKAQLPAQCNNFGGDNILPIDSNGLTLPLGRPTDVQCTQLYLHDGSVMADEVTTEVGTVSLSYGTNQSAAGSCPAPFNVVYKQGSLCLILYSLAGTIDYPWSAATSVQFTYYLNQDGSAAVVVNGTGSRTFTNRFGQSFSVGLSINASATSSDNLLLLNSQLPFDASGLTLLLAAPTQLPGHGPNQTVTELRLYNFSGLVAEFDSYRIDPLGQAYLSTIPRFKNVTIGASNINELAPNYASCKAPITFTNGLRQPTQPTQYNGAVQFQYLYSISDGVNYTVTANLTIFTSNKFATLKDQLGNPYQQIINVTGTRIYTYLPTGQKVVSAVTGLSTAQYAGADQRWYPYSLIDSSPGVYDQNNAPFLDYDGLEYAVSPSTPVNGHAPGTGTQYSAVNVYLYASEPIVCLREGEETDLPNPNLQTQSFILPAAAP